MSENGGKPIPINVPVEQPPVMYRCGYCGKVNPSVKPLIAPPPHPDLPGMVMFVTECCKKLIGCQLAMSKQPESRIITPGE